MTGMILSLCLLAQDEKVAADALIDRFKEAIRAAKTQEAAAQAFEILGEKRHPRVLAELKKWLDKPSPHVSLAAAEQIGKYAGEKEAAAALVEAAGKRRDKEGRARIVFLLGRVGLRPVTPEVARFLKDRDVEVARAAAEACGTLKSRLAMDPLIDMAMELDMIPVVEKPTTDLGDALETVVKDEQSRRKRELTPAVLAALTAITGEDFETGAKWKSWWRKNQAKFKEPE